MYCIDFSAMYKTGPEGVVPQRISHARKPAQQRAPPSPNQGLDMLAHTTVAEVRALAPFRVHLLTDLNGTSRSFPQMKMLCTQRFQLSPPCWLSPRCRSPSTLREKRHRTSAAVTCSEACRRRLVRIRATRAILPRAVRSALAEQGCAPCLIHSRLCRQAQAPHPASAHTANSTAN